MILYRLYVGLEDKDKRQYPFEELEQIIDKHLTGYTLIPSYGHWEGKSEPSCIIEHISTGSLEVIFTLLTKELKEKLNQDTIIITKQALEVNYV